MPIYDGPLWLEALGGLGFLGAIVVLLTADRRGRTLDERLGSTDADRDERRGRYGR